MKIQFSYQKKLVIQALRYHFITRREIKLLIILVNIFAIFSASLFYFHKVTPLAFLISSVLWLSLMISFWYILPNTVYNRAATFKDSFTITLSDSNVRLQNSNAYNEWNYNQFTTWIESPHFIHLYFNSRSFFLIPKAAIERDANLAAIRTLLTAKIGSKG